MWMEGTGDVARSREEGTASFQLVVSGILPLTRLRNSYDLAG
ncbi:MAG TPA: hypothetical protein VGM54_09130 [Chthoniobacter sp.]|jgi:hypothetical protein